MALAPVEIRHTRLKKSLIGGYRKRATNEFLEQITESFEETWREREDLRDRVEALETELKRHRELESLRGEVEKLRKAPRAAARQERVEVPEPDVRAEAGVNVIVQPIDGLDADALLELSDRYKQKHAPAAVVLGSKEDGRVHLVANFDASVAERVSASDVLREAAAIVGGGGGGRPTMARAGGKDPEKLPDALARAEELILTAL